MQNYQFLCLRECFGYNREPFVCPSCVHRVNIGRLRVCVGSILAFNQIRYEIARNSKFHIRVAIVCQNRLGMTPPLNECTTNIATSSDYKKNTCLQWFNTLLRKLIHMYIPCDKICIVAAILVWL